MKIYSDPRLLALGVVGGTVSRHAGNMRERPVQDAFFEKLDIPSSRILRLHQVHGDHILSILTPEQAAHQQKITPLSHADGWILRPKGFGAAVLTADCVPLFLWDKEADLVAWFTPGGAGWRSYYRSKPRWKCRRWVPKGRCRRFWARIFKNAVLKSRKTPRNSSRKPVGCAKTENYL